MPRPIGRGRSSKYKKGKGQNGAAGQVRRQKTEQRDGKFEAEFKSKISRVADRFDSNCSTSWNKSKTDMHTLCGQSTLSRSQNKLKVNSSGI